jgi:transcriptional regulator NrdR family protein
MSTHIVKRRTGYSEPFDAIKLHQSIVATCLAVRVLEGEAHTTAERVVRHTIRWLATRAEVTSADVRRVAAQQLTRHNPEAGYMYEQYRLII